jgi:hypothetical protein
MRITKENLIDQVIAANVAEALRVGFDEYDDERQGFDFEYLEELTPCDLERELSFALAGGQFDE